jgi:hypothetical protein
VGKPPRMWAGWVMVGFLYLSGGVFCWFLYEHTKPRQVMAEHSEYPYEEAQNTLP